MNTDKRIDFPECYSGSRVRTGLVGSWIGSWVGS